MEVWAISREDFEQTMLRLAAEGQRDCVQIAGYDCFELKRSYRPAVLVNTGIAKATFSKQRAESRRIARAVSLEVGL